MPVIPFDWTTMYRGPDLLPGFIATREHRRFVEFAADVRRQRTIGLSFGPAGVGKTWSARRYAHWHRIEPFLLELAPREPSDARIHALAARSRTLIYTPAVGAGLKQMKDDLNYLAVQMGFCISAGLALKDPSIDPMRIAPIELLIVDEAERLNLTALEWLRDLYDRAADPDWHARHREKHGTLRSTLQPRRFRPRIPPAPRGRADIRSESSLENPWPRTRCGRFHRRPRYCSSCSHHRRQLPTAAAPIQSDRPHPRRQQDDDHHRKRR